MKRRITITGIGVITPIGIGGEALWDGLASGRSGIARIGAFDPEAFETQIAAEVTDFKAKEYVRPRKALKVMARDIQFAVAAAAAAVDDAQVKDAVSPMRMGVSIGAGLMSSDVDELGVAIAHATDGDGQFDIQRFGTEGMEHLFPLWLLKYLPNMLACHISIIHDAQGPSNTITTACAAGSQAIGEGCRIIDRGAADVMICGGADSKINPISLVRYSLFSELAKNNAHPEKACRPFDRDRDGFVVGEGAGILVLEELEHAKKRGARIYGEIAGYGMSCDAEAALRGARTGATRAACLRAALADGELTAEDVDYISACGLGSRENDRIEAEAIREVLGPRAPDVLVSSVKSMIGHLGAGAGAVELIAALLALRHGVAPPTRNCDNPEEGLGLNIVANEAREAKINVALCNTASFAGQNAALAIKKYEN